MPCPTPQQSFAAAIARWEGEWQDDPADAGNYAHGWDGSVRLVGTMRGVTPNTYARFRGIDPADLTPEAMRAEITLDIAAMIGTALFYQGTGLATLAWSPLVAAAVDIAWGSGPARAIRMLQALAGAEADGVIGPGTRRAVARYQAARSCRAGCDALADRRAAYYRAISPPGSSSARFRNGWLARAEWFRSSNPVWWGPWARFALRQ